jgi:hypothetical protein
MCKLQRWPFIPLPTLATLQHILYITWILYYMYEYHILNVYLGP